MINNITTVDETQGEYVSVAGNNYRIIISGKQTAGTYAVIDMLVPPGGGPGPHSHAGIHESFYVVEGEVEFKTEGGKYIAKNGAFVNIPLGGEVHCFKNLGNNMAHLLCTVMPAGLEEFFKEVGKPVGEGEFLKPVAPDQEAMKKMKILAEKYGQQLYPPDFLG